MKPWMIYALCVVGGTAGGIAIAKYTLPPRVEIKTETKIQEVEVVKWREKVVVEKGPVKVTTRTVTVPGPAGPTVTVDRIVEKDKVVYVKDGSGSRDTVTQVDEKTSKVIDSRPWMALEGTAGLGLNGRWAGQGAATVRVLGPVWLGLGAIYADTLYLGPAARWEF
jgi:hypothetical protein